MTRRYDVKEFLENPGVIVDVRSPAEYAHAHIPGALSLPLFSDDERALIGTCYKQKSQQDAIDLGLTIVGPRLVTLVKKARDSATGTPLKIHCWRGGMRSGFVASTLDILGIPTSSLLGGYKNYRQWTLSTLSRDFNFRVIGGLTGSAKTAILHALRSQGEQVLDLEGYANHRGSSFGGIGQKPQPSTEHFENMLALELSNFDSTRTVWIEDESRLVGRCALPNTIYAAIGTKPMIYIERPLSERLDHIEAEYGASSPDDLIAATERLRKKLGGARTKDTVNLFRTDRFRDAVALILGYYDKTYQHGLSQRTGDVTPLYAPNRSPVQWAETLIELSRMHS